MILLAVGKLVSSLVWKMALLRTDVHFFGITNDDVTAVFLARYWQNVWNNAIRGMS